MHDPQVRARAPRLTTDNTSNLADLLFRVVDHLDNGAIVGVTDAKGKIIYANAAFCSISGYAQHELLGQDHRVLNSGTHPRSFWKSMYQAVHSGRAWQADVCNRAKDGSLYWVDTTVQGVHDAAGTLCAIISIRLDITARKAAEAASHASLRHLEAMIAGSRAGLWHADLGPSGQLDHNLPCRFSARLVEFLGGTLCAAPVEPRLGTLLDCIHPDERPRVEAALHEHLVSRRPFELPFRLKNGRGEFRHVEARAQASWDSTGKPEWLAGSIDDVTQWVESERRLQSAMEDLISTKEAMALRAQELSQSTRALESARMEADAASRAKSDFLAHMSHEIRTPLNAILGFSELIEDPGSGVNHTEAARTIRRNGAHLLGIINDILDFSKIEAGSFSIAFEPTDPVAEVEQVTTLLSARAAEKGLTLSSAIDPGVPRLVQCDPMRLRQILINLAGNAVKFTDHGSVSILVDAPQPEQLRFRVTDTGIGLSDEQMSLIFVPFRQVDASMSRRAAGSGLGLCISQRLAHMLGGSITVQSTPGHGSVFSLTIPAPLVQPAAAPSSSRAAPSLPALAQPASGTAPLRGINVLLAEDGEDNRRLVCHVLRRSGARVQVAMNGREAVQHVERAARTPDAPHLVLMDMQMPEMDGYEATSALRARGHSLPIIALTAHASTADRKRCLDAGCTDYATKPISPAALTSLCRKFALPQAA